METAFSAFPIAVAFDKRFDIGNRSCMKREKGGTVARRSVRKQRSLKKSIWFVLAATAVISAVLLYRIAKTRDERIELEKNKQAYAALLEEEEQRGEELREREKNGLTVDDIIRIARDRFGLLFRNEIILTPEK